MNAADRLDAFANTLGLVSVVLALAYLPEQAIERRLLDERFRARAEAPAAHPDLIVVALDEKYAARRHYPTAPTADYITRIVRALSAAGVRVIALDIAVTEADTAAPTSPDLVAALAAAPSVVLPSILSVHGVRLDRPWWRLAAEPPPQLRATAPSGFVTFTDAAHPRMQLVVRLDDGTLAASFGLRAVQSQLGLLPPEPEVWQRQGGSHRISERDVALVLDRLGLQGGRLRAEEPALINYHGPVEPRGTIAYVSSEDLLDGLLLQEQLKGKLAVVGAMHSGVTDLFTTPWGEMHGVELHANIINSLLTGSLLRERNSGGWTVALSLVALAVVLVGSVLAWRVPRTEAAVAAAAGVALAFPLALILGAFSAFDGPRGIVLPIATPLKVWTMALLICFAAAFSLGRRGLGTGRPQRKGTISTDSPASAAEPNAVHALHASASLADAPQQRLPRRRADGGRAPAPAAQRGASGWLLWLGSSAVVVAFVLYGRRRD